MCMSGLVFSTLAVLSLAATQYTDPRPAEISPTLCSRVDCPNTADCLDCIFPDCGFGEDVQINCSTSSRCHGPPVTVITSARCRFCWQTDPSEHDCNPRSNCSTVSSTKAPVKCRVHSNVFCMGRRSFYKNVRCNWTSGHSWSKTLVLSLLMGGFGVDRFYLGLWKSAIGKLFSFGGLGIWTVVDVILIATGYIRPADGSNYV